MKSTPYIINSSGELYINENEEWRLVDGIPKLRYNYLHQYELELTCDGRLYSVRSNRIEDTYTDFKQLFHLYLNKYVALRENNEVMIIRYSDDEDAIQYESILTNATLLIRDVYLSNKFIFLDTDNRWYSINIKVDKIVIHLIIKPNDLPTELQGYRDGLLWTKDRLWIVAHDYSTVPITIVNEVDLDCEVLDANILVNRMRRADLYIITKDRSIRMYLDVNNQDSKLLYSHNDEYLRLIGSRSPWTKLVTWNNVCSIIAEDGTGTSIYRGYIAPLDIPARILA